MLSSQELPQGIDKDAFDTPKRTRPMLPLWNHDPVARLYRQRQAIHVVELAGHPAFSSVGLHVSETHEGGAIIHLTDVYTVLALEYEDPDELSDEWCNTLRHYSRWSPAANISMRRLEIA